MNFAGNCGPNDFCDACSSEGIPIFAILAVCSLGESQPTGGRCVRFDLVEDWSYASTNTGGLADWSYHLRTCFN